MKITVLFYIVVHKVFKFLYSWYVIVKAQLCIIKWFLPRKILLVSILENSSVVSRKLSLALTYFAQAALVRSTNITFYYQNNIDIILINCFIKTIFQCQSVIIVQWPFKFIAYHSILFCNIKVNCYVTKFCCEYVTKYFTDSSWQNTCSI